MLNYLAVAIGGALGAICRLFICDHIPYTHKGWTFIIPTLCINLIGSIIIGIAWYLATQTLTLSLLWRQFIIVGFIGAFTTFSTFSLDLFRLIQIGSIFPAFIYMISSIILCLIGTASSYHIMIFFK